MIGAGTPSRPTWRGGWRPGGRGRPPGPLTWSLRSVPPGGTPCAAFPERRTASSASWLALCSAPCLLRRVWAGPETPRAQTVSEGPALRPGAGGAGLPGHTRPPAWAPSPRGALGPAHPCQPLSCGRCGAGRTLLPSGPAGLRSDVTGSGARSKHRREPGQKAHRPGDVDTPRPWHFRSACAGDPADS